MNIENICLFQSQIVYDCNGNVDVDAGGGENLTWRLENLFSASFAIKCGSAQKRPVSTSNLLKLPFLFFRQEVNIRRILYVICKTYLAAGAHFLFSLSPRHSITKVTQNGTSSVSIQMRATHTTRVIMQLMIPTQTESNDGAYPCPCFSFPLSTLVGH